jgi:hypothetical protein
MQNNVFSKKIPTKQQFSWAQPFWSLVFGSTKHPESTKTVHRYERVMKFAGATDISEAYDDQCYFALKRPGDIPAFPLLAKWHRTTTTLIL